MNCASARCRRATPPRMTEKRAPGDLRRGFEIEAAELLAELDVILRREVELARLAPAAHFDVRGLVAAVGHGLVQQCSGRPSCQASSSAWTLGDGRIAGRELAGQLLGALRAAALASSPLPLAMPTALALALRSARTRSDSICAALRRSSSAMNAATSSVKPRRARLAATRRDRRAVVWHRASSFSLRGLAPFARKWGLTPFPLQQDEAHTFSFR